MSRDWENSTRQRGKRWFHDPSSHRRRRCRRRWMCWCVAPVRDQVTIFSLQALKSKEFKMFLHDDVKEEEDCFDDSVYSTEVIALFSSPIDFHPPTIKTKRKRGNYKTFIWMGGLVAYLCSTSNRIVIYIDIKGGKRLSRSAVLPLLLCRLCHLGQGQNKAFIE